MPNTPLVSSRSRSNAFPRTRSSRSRSLVWLRSHSLARLALPRTRSFVIVLVNTRSAGEPRSPRGVEFIEKGTVNKQIFNNDVPTAPPLNISSEDAHKDVERSLTSRSNVASSAADAKVSSITKEEDILRNTVSDVGTQILCHLRINVMNVVHGMQRASLQQVLLQSEEELLEKCYSQIISGEAAHKPKISIGKMKVQVRKIKMAFDPPSSYSSLSLKLPIVKGSAYSHESTQYIKQISGLLKGSVKTLRSSSSSHDMVQAQGDRVRESQMDCSAEQGEFCLHMALKIVLKVDLHDYKDK
ncbi:hypothetical protein Syun_008840 [Stephania yunnanensis]|uniref:Uncharacterized protein n=1 Tax=Stephania yunnanensis TaxID=152371 RepID=A0AAP0KD99_9MAGN